jgi:farnesyl diphosphate synthase
MEDALEARLPAADEVPARLHQAMRYSVLGGGKRIRPALLFATAKTLGLTEQEVEAAACAVELIHVYSLVHDDLPAMDDDDLRRGRPTCHKAFDEATAVLVGDALQPLAFQLLARDRALPSAAAIRVRLIDILCEASGTFGMAGGQAIDLAVQGQRPPIEQVEDMHARKTGALIRASVLMAAACVPNLDPALYAALNRFAAAIGLAFQIQDDLLDVLGDVSTLGKATGADRQAPPAVDHRHRGVPGTGSPAAPPGTGCARAFRRARGAAQVARQLAAVQKLLICSSWAPALRGRVRATVLLMMACLVTAAVPAAPAGPPLELAILPSGGPPGRADSVTGGALDAAFQPLPDQAIRRPAEFWLRVAVPGPNSFADGDLPVLVVHAARETRVDVFAGGAPLPLAARLTAFRGIEDRVFILPSVPGGGRPLYLRIDARGIEPRGVSLSVAALGPTLASGAAHARMIAGVVGGLAALSLAALIIWFVMSDRLFILYPTFFLLQALYVAFLSGEGFDWPLLWHARALNSFAWNVPVGLSGAVGCLFAREIADLKQFSPRIYAAFGWFALAFLAVTAGNLAKLFGFGLWVNAAGNLVFLAASMFTLIVSFMSWRRGNRAAGWYLVAWGLLEGFTIASAVGFLMTPSEHNENLLYYGLPLSMLAAAVLIALGVADRLRAQRAALSDAERRAQSDPLTGVLNRRSLIERLEAASLRARARGLPIAVLFIDLDHFKLINDSFGHQAGDACLRAIIGPIHAELRQSDVIGRYGGEEFVVILSSADAAAASTVAARILERVANIRVEGFGRPISVTCSIGVAASDALGVWGEQLINRADAAVYHAKRAGRNQLKMAEVAPAEADTV